MMDVLNMPPQAQPLSRSSYRVSRPTVASRGITPSSSPVNTCDCYGDQTYNQCSITRNDCLAGFYAECNAGPYNCGCTCKPVG